MSRLTLDIDPLRKKALQDLAERQNMTMVQFLQLLIDQAVGKSGKSWTEPPPPVSPHSVPEDPVERKALYRRHLHNKYGH